MSLIASLFTKKVSLIYSEPYFNITGLNIL